MSRQRKTPPPKRRNPYHDHPLLKKGGAHGKTRKAERRAARVRTKQQRPDHAELRRETPYLDSPSELLIDRDRGEH